jgi:hypothetical protein
MNSVDGGSNETEKNSSKHIPLTITPTLSEDKKEGN